MDVEINSSINLKKSPHVKRNFVFNVIYQLLVVLTPLITAPYIARILGADNIGKFSFAYAIVSYFIIFANLGFTQYAQRAIAEAQKDKTEQSKIFWQIVILRLIPISLSLLALGVLYAVGFFGNYSQLIFIFALLVISCAFDINFYFHGKENFFIVMIFNLIIRLVYLFLIFTLIKSRNDINIYILLYSLTIALGYLSMWALLPKNLQKVRLNSLNFKKHMKSSLALFIPVAAVSIYALLDRTLIGSLIRGQQYVFDVTGSYVQKALISEVENGYYYQAERIIKALLSILLAFGMVMTTRNSIEYSSHRLGAIKKNVYRSFRFVFAIGIPMALGTVMVANSFVPLYFGKNYFYDPRFLCDGVANLLMLYSPVIILTGVSNILGAQYLLPTKQDKKYAISVAIGFMFNLGMNYLLIAPEIGNMGASGAVVGTIISEFMIAFIQYTFVRKDFSLKVILIGIYKYVVAGITMCLIGVGFYYFILKDLTSSNLLNLLILIPSGIGIYYLVLLLLKDHTIFRYTKFAFKTIGHFFKGRINKAMVQALSFLTTITSNSDYNNLTTREVPYHNEEDGKK